ncbi:MULTISPECIES: hypothetical protein [unclassified Luteimonas]|uniref:hypothetical protein n=1 Tax=unclassified Luteimonas TaxID=2629088 RepID=UPI001600D1F2|nr:MULTISPECIES: hypothetical protein [unclassified Luteimonas]MBB1472712.1 hypothetical protein [Luteimonas sp. MC1782]MBB6598583.1 hypothetical protein [Luteimonas sp. MC1825]QOC88760.1 hypothetical protein IDM46_03145 [Luteimonas sp. MC1825]
MKGRDGYAVFFFPQALEALGEAIKPYIQDNPVVGQHLSCDEIDTGGGLIEMTMKGHTPAGEDVTLEMMVPATMVRMVVSRQSGGMFGFGPRTYDAAAGALPVIAGPAPPASAPPQSVPEGGPGGDVAPVADPGDAAAKPAP